MRKGHLNKAKSLCPHDCCMVLLMQKELQGLQTEKRPAVNHDQTDLNAAIEHGEKPFLPLNEDCFDKELALDVGDVGYVIGADANADIDFSTQLSTGRLRF